MFNFRQKPENTVEDGVVQIRFTKPKFQNATDIPKVSQNVSFIWSRLGLRENRWLVDLKSTNE